MEICYVMPAQEPATMRKKSTDHMHPKRGRLIFLLPLKGLHLWIYFGDYNCNVNRQIYQINQIH